jgi:hypothetical protein
MAGTTLPNDSLQTNWREVWEAYASAKFVADEYERAVFNPAWEKIRAVHDAMGAIHNPVTANGGKLLSIDEQSRIEAEFVPDWDAISDKMEELNAEVYGERRWAVLLTPAPDRAALEWKINVLFGDSGDYCNSVRMDGVNAFLDDVRRMVTE